MEDTGASSVTVDVVAMSLDEIDDGANEIQSAQGEVVEATAIVVADPQAQKAGRSPAITWTAQRNKQEAVPISRDPGRDSAGSDGREQVADIW